MLPEMYGAESRARERQEYLLREAEQYRLVNLSRAKVTTERNRRFRLFRRRDRGLTTGPVTGQLDGTGATAPPTLVREPAV